MRVIIYLIRHSLSCANLAKQYCSSIINSRVQKARKCRDPLLSNWPFFQDEDQIAKAQVEEIRLLLKNENIDRVFSSFLLRTMETAHALFPNAIITPVPYINETGKGLDNKALPWLDQKEILEKKYESKSLGWLNPDFIRSERWQNQSEANFEKFKDFFDSEFGDWIQLYQKVRNQQNNIPRAEEKLQPIKLAIVTHSNIMKKIFKSISMKEGAWKKANNNGVYMLEYDYTPTTKLRDSQWILKHTEVIHQGMIVPKYRAGFEKRCRSSCRKLVTDCTKNTKNITLGEEKKFPSITILQANETIRKGQDILDSIRTATYPRVRAPSIEWPIGTFGSTDDRRLSLGFSDPSLKPKTAFGTLMENYNEDDLFETRPPVPRYFDPYSNLDTLIDNNNGRTSDDPMFNIPPSSSSSSSSLFDALFN